MTINIQMNRKVSDSDYQDIYPTSDAAKIERRQKIISYLDGDTLEAVIQDTANQYINPFGSTWLHVNTFDTNTTCLCGVDNFTCLLYVEDGTLYSVYSANNGLDWTIYSWSLTGLSLDNMVGAIAVKGTEKNTFNICIANATSTSYYLTVDVNNSENNTIQSFATFSGTVKGVTRTRDSFMMYGSSASIYLNAFNDTSSTRSWTRSSVSFSTETTKVLYSNKYCKPIGIVGLNQTFPTTFTNTATWSTSVVTPTGTTITDLDITGDIFLGSNGIIYDTVNDKTYTAPALSNDSWKYILTTTDGKNIFLMSAQGRVARKIDTDGAITLVSDVLLGDTTESQFILLNNQIIGAIRGNGDTQTSLFRAPLFSYK